MIYILQSIGLPVDSLYDIPILLADSQAISLRIAKILLRTTKSSYSVLGTGYQSNTYGMSSQKSQEMIELANPVAERTVKT